MEHSSRHQRTAGALIRKHRETILALNREREMLEFKGNDVMCPVCNGSFSSFAPVYKLTCREEAGQEDVFKVIRESDHGRCPQCDAHPRHRLLWKYLHECSGLFSRGSVALLEVAPSLPFFELFNHHPNIQYFPCDLFPDQEKYRQFPDIVTHADLQNLPFGDGTFDVFLCSHVLEHVEDDLLAIRELKRVLKPGGWGVVQVPVFYSLEHTLEDPDIVHPKERERVYGQSDHRRKYGRDILNRFLSGGLDFIEIPSRDLYSEGEMERFGLDRFERLYHCSKEYPSI